MSGIYFHIPFCSKKCTYCDFHFSTNIKNNIHTMTKKMVGEFEFRQAEIKNKKIKSIYFGGGTPSLLKKEDFKLFFNSLNNINTDLTKEITIEVNPEDINKQNIALWKSFGINRLSIGIQSIYDEQLKWMNRSHESNQNLKSIELAQSFGFDNISIDLIYGLPKMTSKQWEMQLDCIKEWGIQHVSAYCLTVENKTALMHFVKTGKVVIPSEEKQIEQFIILTNKLCDFGFEHYEISNFSKPNYRAIHNSSYWNGETYIGIGPSAHSFNGKKRRWNVSNNQKYLKANFLNKGWHEEEVLSKTEQWNELILTKLRTINGIKKSELTRFGEIDKEFDDKINDFMKLNWINKQKDSYKLTLEGKLRADHIASELFK